MDEKPPNLPVATWWIIWFALGTGLLFLYFMLGDTMTGESSNELRYFPLVPLFASVGIRWFLLPKATDKTKGLRIFIIGMALAEACGITGIILVPDLKQTYFLLALLGIAQYAPYFAARYEK